MKRLTTLPELTVPDESTVRKLTRRLGPELGSSRAAVGERVNPGEVTKRRSAWLGGPVPALDDPAALPLPQDVDGGGVERQDRGGADLEAHPGDRQSPQKVTVRERDRRRLLPGEPAQERPSAGIDLCWRLAAWAAVCIDLPSRPLGPDVGAGQALIVSVVELPQERRYGGPVEARELGCAEGPLQVARVRSAEMDRAQHPPEPAGLLLALRQQRQVGPAGVLPGPRPGRSAVAHQVKIERHASGGSLRAPEKLGPS